MHVVFLDIDGVLNSGKHFMDMEGEPRSHGRLGDEQYAKYMLDPEAVARLNRIFDATKAVAVISSSWRIAHSLPAISWMLRYRGFTGKVIGATPVSSGQRGDEIQEWLDLVPVESFVILDDDSDMQHLRPFLVKTSFPYGLLDEHVDLAIEVIQGKK